jgi:hypothetical protein
MDADFVPKYPSELFLHFRSIDRFVYRVSDLFTIMSSAKGEILQRLDNCHIYLIGKRPRVTLIPESVIFDNARVTFRIQYKLNGVLCEQETSIARDVFQPDEVAFDAGDYPHRVLVGRDASGNERSRTLLSNAIHAMPGVPQPVGDLEIVYIGKGLSNNTQDRLAQHETLQRILADINSNEPDVEVFAVVHSFQYQKPAFVFLGRQSEITGPDVHRRNVAALVYRPNLDDQIQLIEASLISYFKTDRYNTHYLDFPAGDYKVLRPAYEADFAAIIVQLDHTNIFNQRIFSATVPPAATHYINVDFRALEGRQSVLALRK